MTHKIYVRVDNPLRLIVGYIKINKRLLNYNIYNI